MGLESKYQAECVRTFLWKRYMFIDPVKGDGNCLFNAVIQELEFDTPEDKHFYTSDRLRRQVVAFFTGRKEEYVDWIRTQIRNIYGWSDRYSKSEPGPFSVKTYLKHILEDGKWGDIIVLYLLAAMWGIRITVIRGDACVQLNIRHNEDLINADLILLYNGMEISGHYTGVVRLDQTKLKCASIKKTAKFDYRMDKNEMDQKFHNLQSTEVVVKSDRLATLVAKEVEYDDLMKMYDEMKRKYKIKNKKLKQKRKLIRNMRRLLGKDKNGGDDDDTDDEDADEEDIDDNTVETEETEPEVPQNIPQISQGDVTCELCDRKLPGTHSLRKHMDKMHKGKAKYKCTKCKKVFITYQGKKNCELKHEGRPKPYQCSVGDCEVRFLNRRSQKKHELEQHGARVLEKKFKCNYGNCVYKSHIKSNLVQHEKGCKFNFNKKEYKCELCGKGKFYLYKKVQEHKRKEHKGYK